MKRVKAACILQTLVFAQKPEMGYSKDRALKINHEELEHYKATLERSKTDIRVMILSSRKMVLSLFVSESSIMTKQMFQNRKRQNASMRFLFQCGQRNIRLARLARIFRVQILQLAGAPF